MTENRVPSNAKLIEPIPQMGLAYRKFLREFIEAGEVGTLLHIPDETEAPELSILSLRNHARGLHLPDGWGPYSTYWLVSDEEVLLGEIRIRHILTPALEDYGGQIGYMIRPGERRKGYATSMLAMALDKSRELGLKKVMVTCEPENIASAHVIRKNGGRLAVSPGTRTGRMAERYWIDL